MPSAVLNAVTFLAQSCNAFVGRTHAINFVTDILGVLPREASLGEAVVQGFRYQHGNLPFVFTLGNARSGNLRTEYDAAFRARLGAAATLFIASAGRKQDHCVC